MALERIAGFRSGVLRVAHTAVERVHPTALSVFDVDKLRAEEQEKGYAMLSGKNRAILCVSYKPAGSERIIDDYALCQASLRHDTRVTIAGVASANSAMLDLYSPYRASVDAIFDREHPVNGEPLDESTLDQATQRELAGKRDCLAQDEKVLAGDMFRGREHLLERIGIDPQTVLRARLLVRTNGSVRE